jgi:hypothetical protein
VRATCFKLRLFASPRAWQRLQLRRHACMYASSVHRLKVRLVNGASTLYSIVATQVRMLHAPYARAHTEATEATQATVVVFRH